MSALQELTPRECEVLRILSGGQTNRSIATTLGLAEATICYHLKSIFRKLGVSNRTAAATKALRLGLFEHVGGAAS